MSSKEQFFVATGLVAVWLVARLLAGAAFLLLWNLALVPFVGVPIVGYVQALALLYLVRLLGNHWAPDRQAIKQSYKELATALCDLYREFTKKGGA